MAKQKLNFMYLPQTEVKLPQLVETYTSKDFVNYGQNNLFPQSIWDLFSKSSILQAIICGTTDFVCGNEVKCVLGDTVNNDGQTVEELIRQIAIDELLYGGFCLNVIYNRGGKVGEIYWVDMKNIRINEDETIAYYSKNWKTRRNIVKYNIWGNESSDSDVEKGSCIYYSKGHLSRGTYPVGRWFGSIPSVQTSCEISNYHLNSILHRFEPSAIINFNNGVPDEEVQNNIEAKVNEKFAGSTNAGRTLIAFNDNKDSAVTIERLGDDNTDKKYEQLRRDTIMDIFATFRCTPQIFGMQLNDNALFSNEEFAEAYGLYDKNVVKPLQKTIQRAFDKILDTTGSVTFVDWSYGSAVARAEDVVNPEDKNTQTGNNEE